MASSTRDRDTGPMTTHSSTSVIRQWARDQGLAVGDRGRLAPEVLEAYRSGQADAVAAPPAKPALAPSRSTGGTFQIKPRPSSGATGMSRRVRVRSS